MNKSYLFVPGDRLDRIKKALNSEADIIIIDLEDAVPLHKKIETRKNVEQFLSTVQQEEQKRICLRVNAQDTDFYLDDVQMVANFPRVAVMLPKANTKEEIYQLEKKLSEKQVIVPLIETAMGVIHAYEIARASQKIDRLAFGAVDYCYELGISLSDHGDELIYPRSALVVASRAAMLKPPIDTVYTNIAHEEGLIIDINRAKNLGLTAKLCIHPAQLQHVNTLFNPSKQEIAWAKKVIVAYKDALQEGVSAIRVDDEMIDLPVYKKALNMLQTK